MTLFLDGMLTGRVGNFTLAVVPIILLGTINLGLYVYSTVLGTARTVTRILFSPFTFSSRTKETQSNDYARL
jgi:dimethylaniline monooxygenase (N-oxide forming)